MEKELSDESLEPVKKHYSLASLIRTSEEQKKQAVLDEEFEEAARIKKVIMGLKEQCMTTQRLRSEFLDKVPTLRLKTMLELVNEIDPIFAKNFLE